MSKGIAGKIKINSFEDIVGDIRDGVTEVELSELHDFENHPFRVLDDEKMDETVESIREHGVLMPGIVRPRKQGGYEIIAGHRRKHACERAGLTKMPVFVRDYSDDEATVIMVDTNIQREDILGAESEQFTFFRIPKILIKDKRFEGLSNDAKLLYGLLLDRMSLSMKNKWFDPENRAYIVYTVEEVMEDMNCANGKASKLLISLEQIGLIERRKLGLGRPAITYVKNFMSILRNGETQEEREEGNQKSYQQAKKPANPVSLTDMRLSHGKGCDNQMSGGAEIECHDVRESHDMICDNYMTRDEETIQQEMRGSHTNNTNINNIGLNENDLNHTHSIQTVGSYGRIDCSRPIKLTMSGPEGRNGVLDTYVMNEKEMYENLVKENLFYNYYMESTIFTDEGKKLFDIMTQRIVRMAVDTPEYIMVKDHKIPGQVAKSVFLKLRGEHIMYCIEKIENVNGKIRHPGAYMDALLFSSYSDFEEKDSVEVLQAAGSYKKNNFWT